MENTDMDQSLPTPENIWSSEAAPVEPNGVRNEEAADVN